VPVGKIVRDVIAVIAVMAVIALVAVIASEPSLSSGLLRRWHVAPTFPRNALGVSRKW
jgi:hypothetical protein